MNGKDLILLAIGFVVSVFTFGMVMRWGWDFGGWFVKMFDAFQKRFSPASLIILVVIVLGVTGSVISTILR